MRMYWKNTWECTWEFLTDQIWENLSIKMNDSNGNEKGSPKCILIHINKWEEKKDLFTVVCQVFKWNDRVKKKKSPFCSHQRNVTQVETITGCWNHWVDICGETGHSHSLKVSPTEYLLITRGKWYLWSGEIWQTSLNQMIIVNITSNGTKCHQVPLRWSSKEAKTSLYIGFLPWMHNPNLIMKTHQTNPNWRTFY